MPIDRREFVKMAGLAAAAGVAYPAAAATGSRPNILVLIADEVSMDALQSPIRNGYIKTPNLDRLAAESTIFTRAYAANALCTPSRTAMFTGRYPVETGVETNTPSELDTNRFPMIGTMFQRSGYKTSYFGKWHIPVKESAVEQHGFVEMDSQMMDRPTEEQVVGFLQEKHDKPFFAVASFVDPHDICEWARGQVLKQGAIGPPPIPADCPPLRANHGPQRDEPPIMRLMKRSYQSARMFPVGDWTDDKWRQYEWAYYRLIELIDAKIGKVLDALEQSDAAKNTVVVFLSDHGDCQGAHGWNQKTVFYEEAERVPLYIRAAGRVSHSKSDALVNTGIDFLPTLCDFAGIAVASGLHGKSLRPLVLGKHSLRERKFVVASNHLAQGALIDGHLPSPEGRMLRSERYKYCVYSEGDRRESLVDLVADPGEMQNLANEPAHHAALLEHRRMLRSWGRELNDAFPYPTEDTRALTNPSLSEPTQTMRPPYVVGMDLGGTNLRLLLADINGTPIARKKGSIQTGSTPKEIVSTIKLFLRELFEEVHLPFEELGMFGGGIPGVTNCETGVIQSAPFLAEWKDVPLRALLEDELRVPVFLENDANMAAYGEARAGIAQSEDDFVFLAIGTGLGAGMFLRGELYQGANWGAGEIGYLRLCGACDALFDMSAAGPLESLVGGRGIERAWSETFVQAGAAKSESATDIFELAKGGHPVAAKLLDRTATLLSEAIAALTFVLDCPLVVLGGGVGNSTILQQAILNQSFFQRNFAKPRLEISRLGQDAQLIGAIHLAIDKMKKYEQRRVLADSHRPARC